MRISEANFRQDAEAYAGYCRECDAITREETEPDAEGYDCPVCELPAVMGLEDALIAGHILFDESMNEEPLNSDGGVELPKQRETR